jgi:HlyD family secretion protein
MKPPDLVIQGEVEATQVQASSKIAGRIDDVLVKKGDTVKKGQLLAVIDSPEIRAKLRQVEAARNVAGAQSEKADKGAREEEIKTAYALWLRAKAGADLAGKTYERVQRLHRDGVLATQKLDEAEGQWETAKDGEAAAKAAYDMVLKGARKEDIKSARALVDQASGAVAEVESYLAETRILSPTNGEIADIMPEKGELISAGYPVMLIIDLSDIWVTFNVREDLLVKIRMGTILEARFPALGSKIARLKVNYIANLGDFAAWRATKASGDFDLKTFEVRAVPVEPLTGLRPGMSAVIEWGKLKGPEK